MGITVENRGRGKVCSIKNCGRFAGVTIKAPLVIELNTFAKLDREFEISICEICAIELWRGLCRMDVINVPGTGKI